MPTDEQLVEAACNGDGSAFPALVVRYQERLLRFLLTRCASRADAEDVLQDTFINAYKYLASFDPRYRFSTWLYRIGLREAARGASPGAEPDAEIADWSADPLRLCLRDDGRENLWVTAKGLLTPDAYAAMWLRYVEDMSIRDVARALERSETWAKVTLMRSRNRLAESFSDTNDAEPKRGTYG